MKIIEEMRNQEELLKEAGAQEVEHYTLINNDGYTFNKGGKKYDMRHWINMYGGDVDFWSIGGNGTERSCGTFQEAVEIIKGE